MYMHGRGAARRGRLDGIAVTESMEIERLSGELGGQLEIWIGRLSRKASAAVVEKEGTYAVAQPPCTCVEWIISQHFLWECRPSSENVSHRRRVCALSDGGNPRARLTGNVSFTTAQKNAQPEGTPFPGLRFRWSGTRAHENERMSDKKRSAVDGVT